MQRFLKEYYGKKIGVIPEENFESNFYEKSLCWRDVSRMEWLEVLVVRGENRKVMSSL